ncbi:hypothetical protein [Flavobacterium frigidarium]|jgi:hypothetical protein|uniref:hypothetical protein n=1 Tax=Flavobacterium frigidarium TaxID=99286 RepID=UPI00041FE81B|nr:hypothetical protein [Flavobacterium frigidarium]
MASTFKNAIWAKLIQDNMSRNNDRNIKKHNDKLHKAQDKAKLAKITRAEKLKQITKKFNETKASEEN